MLVPPGLITTSTTARHLRVHGRQLRKLTEQTALSTVAPVALGRAMGSFGFVPQVGVMALRQIRSGAPYRLTSWQAALEDILKSGAWQRAIQVVRSLGRIRRVSARSTSFVEDLLLSPLLRDEMLALQEESLAALEEHELAGQFQIEPLIVDRIEDEDDAVVLVGSEGRAFSLPRALLQAANLERDKARGILVATQTGAGVDVDVWPSVGEDEPRRWEPDAELLALRQVPDA